MLFDRREPMTYAECLRIALWPRHSWRRSLRYATLRLRRLEGSPHVLALGLAVGVFASFQPILGFQMLSAGIVAWLLGASVGAALLGTFAGSPLTWPPMWLASYHVGALILGEQRGVTVVELWSALSGLAMASAPGSHAAAAGGLVWQVLWPLCVGALPVGLMAAALIYAMVLRVLVPVRVKG